MDKDSMMNKVNKEINENVKSEDKKVRHSRNEMVKDAFRLGSMLVGMAGLIIKVVNDKTL